MKKNSVCFFQTRSKKALVSSKESIDMKTRGLPVTHSIENLPSGSKKCHANTPTVARKLLKSFRASVRLSGQRTHLSAFTARKQSPHVADDTGSIISLTSLATGVGSLKKYDTLPLSDTSLPAHSSKVLSLPDLKRKRFLPTPRIPTASATMDKTGALQSEDGTKIDICVPGNTPKITRQPSKHGSHIAGSKNDHSEDKWQCSAPEKPAMLDEGSASACKRASQDVAASAKEICPNTKVGGQTAYMYDNYAEATFLFEMLIHPVLPEVFFREIWERKPLLVRRNHTTPDYSSVWFSAKELDNILREECIQYGVNLDITSYTDGKRETHNPTGRAYAPVVWDFYQKGCSVRLLNPQTYSQNMWNILSILQDFFHCSVGANVYLTPPGTQGFAPHYDDIEAFVLQLEGHKHWKLYSPRSEDEVLPRCSSENLSQDDLSSPILDAVLKPGDMLYFPRGTIHQAVADESVHSLHVTFSCYQRNTWGHLLEKLLPQALSAAIEGDIEFRRGLPLDYLKYMGVIHADEENGQRGNFQKTVNKLVRSVMDHLPLDAACDQMGKQAIHDALPPVLTNEEKVRTVVGDGESFDRALRHVRARFLLAPDTRVRVLRGGLLRMIMEEDTVRIYHSLDNARSYHAHPNQYIEVSAEIAPAVEYMIDVYPEFVPVGSLPLDTLAEKLDLAKLLYDKGLLMTEAPMRSMRLQDSSTIEG